ncbi:MAG: hypothetical protein AB1696_10975 [Planctomycetota bacterium]
MAEHVAKSDTTYDIMAPDAPFEAGFSWKTVWGALFVGIVMMPGAIYLGLVTGHGVSGGAEWVTIILFLEIAKRAFIKLKTQEIIILYWACGGLVTMGGKLGTGVNLFGGPFGGMVWDQYLVQSPQAIGLSEYIPDWLVPPKTSEALLERSYLHPAWIKPIVILIVVMVFSRVCGLSMSYILYRLTNDVERLPFPMARVHAGGCTALAETSAKTEGWRWRVFSIGSFIGVIWGLILVVVPTLSGIFLTDTWQILPIPFIDFTPSIKSILPATILGLGTDIGSLLAGFVLPFWMIVGTFIATFLVTFIINPLILYPNGYLDSWEPGMSSIPTAICNSMDFWLSFTIGTAFVVMILGLGLTVRAFIRGRQRSWEDEGAGADEARVHPDRGDLPLWIPFILWAFGVFVFVVLVYWLVPDFPWWISAIFGFIWSPIYSYVVARMIGLTGSPQGVQFPYLREASFYLSGYKGAAVWFAPIPLHTHAGVDGWKQLELTHTKFSSMVYLSCLSLVVMLVCSFIFWSMIWKLQPIPSSAYPFVQKMWPFHATMQSLWAKSTIPELTPLCDFEGADASRPEPEGVKVEPVGEYPTRELTSLKITPIKGAEKRIVRFNGLQENWTGGEKPAIWFETDFYAKGCAPEVILRIRQVDGATFEKKFLLDEGKNIIGIEVAEPEPESDRQTAGDKEMERIFVKNLPERLVRELEAKTVRFKDFKTTDGKAVDATRIAGIEFEFPGEKDFDVYLDNATLLGEARAFILKFIQPRLILAGFCVGWLSYIGLALVGAPALVFYGCIAGITGWIHYSVLTFFGAMMGRFYFRPRFGEEQWRAYSPILLAGYSCGFALIGMTSVAIRLIATSISTIVF